MPIIVRIKVVKVTNIWGMKGNKKSNYFVVESKRKYKKRRRDKDKLKKVMSKSKMAS